MLDNLYYVKWTPKIPVSGMVYAGGQCSSWAKPCFTSEQSKLARSKEGKAVIVIDNNPETNCSIMEHVPK